MSHAILFHFLFAQHVSDINTFGAGIIFLILAQPVYKCE